MKDKFSHYYKLEDDEYVELIKKGTIVLDTNVLFFLYRSPEPLRKELIALLDSIKDRIWIPYQVALEYQERRLSVISGQKNIFNKVKNAINSSLGKLKNDISALNLKSRHSIIDTTKFLEEIDDISNAYKAELDVQASTAKDVNEKDVIRDYLDVLLEGKVGEPFDTQDKIDEISKEGDRRRELKLPPGYKDNDKEGGVSCNRVYIAKKDGDIIIWKQIIEYCKKTKCKGIIFVTEDSKEDWWNEVDGKKIGPRVELLDEIKREGGAPKFQMYSLTEFIRFANESLNLSISDTVADDVSEISQAFKLGRGSGVSSNDDMMGSYFHLLNIKSQLKSQSDVSGVASCNNLNMLQVSFVNGDTANIYIGILSSRSPAELDTLLSDYVLNLNYERFREVGLVKTPNKYILILGLFEPSMMDVVTEAFYKLKETGCISYVDIGFLSNDEANRFSYVFHSRLVPTMHIKG